MTATNEAVTVPSTLAFMLGVLLHARLGRAACSEYKGRNSGTKEIPWFEICNSELQNCNAPHLLFSVNLNVAQILH